LKGRKNLFPFYEWQENGADFPIPLTFVLLAAQSEDVSHVVVFVFVVVVVGYHTRLA